MPERVMCVCVCLAVAPSKQGIESRRGRAGEQPISVACCPHFPSFNFHLKIRSFLSLYLESLSRPTVAR